MTNQQIAAQMFNDRTREIIELDFRGVGNEQEINARYGFKHGWIVVNGESFNMEKATGVAYDANQGGWAWL